MEPLHLAIDSSCAQPAIAVLHGDECLRSWQGESGPNHGELVLQGIDTCLQESAVKPEDLEFISVGIGPGTFTGLRIGISTAKFLAYSWKKKVVDVSSLYALAQSAIPSYLETKFGAEWSAKNTANEERSIWSLIDAKRHEVYAVKYSLSEIQSKQDQYRERESAISPEDLAKKIGEQDLLLGDGAENFREHWPESCVCIDFKEKALDAANLGLVGLVSYKNGHIMEAEELSARYFRTEKF